MKNIISPDYEGGGPKIKRLGQLAIRLIVKMKTVRISKIKIPKNIIVILR